MHYMSRYFLIGSANCITLLRMTDDGKGETVQIRVSTAEKDGFVKAAELAGIPLSAWVRERLRRAARVELESSGLSIPFVKQPEG